MLPEYRINVVTMPDIRRAAIVVDGPTDSVLHTTDPAATATEAIRMARAWILEDSARRARQTTQRRHGRISADAARIRDVTVGPVRMDCVIEVTRALTDGLYVAMVQDRETSVVLYVTCRHPDMMDAHAQAVEWVRQRTAQAAQAEGV